MKNQRQKMKKNEGKSPQKYKHKLSRIVKYMKFYINSMDVCKEIGIFYLLFLNKLLHMK